MKKITGSIKVDNPERIIKKLCKHFERKVKVDYPSDTFTGINTVNFPMGQCDIYKHEKSIVMDIYNWNEEVKNGKNGLEMVKYILNEHVAQFNYKEDSEINWN